MLLLSLQFAVVVVFAVDVVVANICIVVIVVVFCCCSPPTVDLVSKETYKGLLQSLTFTNGAPCKARSTND